MAFYNGPTETTKDGLQCMRWRDAFEDQKDEILIQKNRDAIENFLSHAGSGRSCRIPPMYDIKKPWCYVEAPDGEHDKSECDIQYCRMY